MNHKAFTLNNTNFKAYFLQSLLLIGFLLLHICIKANPVKSSIPKELAFSNSENKTEIQANTIQFVQSEYNISLQQGTSQSISEYISTSDNLPIKVSLKAIDGGRSVPSWLRVNNSLLNNISYTTGSEITFVVNSTYLTIGTYSATVTASATNYTNAVLVIKIIVTDPNSSEVNLKVNFQDSTTSAPSGWLKDFGQPFGKRTSPQQGSGNKYGWLKLSDKSPLNLRANGRKRTSPSDILLATFMHMQGNSVPTFTGAKIEGYWEGQIKNGLYDVTVSVGDGTQIDSKHSINVEGVNFINNFIPTSSQKFYKVTRTICIADNYLTIDAGGGYNTKINWVTAVASTTNRPSVVSVSPQSNATDVSVNASISTSILKLPNGGINNNTITSTTVTLEEEATGLTVASNVNGTGGGDAITLVPKASLKTNTTYRFTISSGVKDVADSAFVPYSIIFKTGSDTAAKLLNVAFDKIILSNTIGQHSSITIGPDNKLYAITIDGIIKRFAINTDGTLGTPQLIYSLQDEYGTRQKRLAVGLAFDPASTATNLIAWVTHSSFMFVNGPDWDGKLTKLTGINLENTQDVLINLPRSKRDHLTNSIGFGPDNNLYFTQGSNSGMGRADNTWGLRSEHLLSAAVLKLNLSLLNGLTLPLDVKTSEGGGFYNPFAVNTPLTIYASGVRNAYDLLWHSNGQLYVAANGSAAGGNTPSSVSGTMRTNGSLYSGPIVPELTNVQQTQKDYLFKIQKGGYYGHPNALRGEYVLNGGNPTSGNDSAQVDAYPVGTLPDPNYKGFAFDFQSNKSPDGTIEYKSSTFNNALKGKILIVRYSQNDDIIVLTPGGTNKNIISYTEGAGIPGFSGFSDPLDLVENKLNGNIYVSEYGGNGQIVLLKPKTTQQITTNLSPVADAQIRGGIYASTNYGRDSSMMVKGATNGDFKRATYLKFNLPSLNNITSAKLRFYAKNIENTSTVTISAYGGNNDGWAETTINNTNAPAAATLLGSVGVSSQLKYYDVDVTSFVKNQATVDNVVTFLLKDASTQNIGIKMNSKEFGTNTPKLVIVSNEYTSLTQSSVANPALQSLSNSSPALNSGVSNTTGYVIPECDAPESSAALAAVASQTVLSPIADAFVRNGTYANANYGSDTSLIIKGSASAGFARNSYLKFNLSTLTNVSSAKLRIYGNNTDDATAINLSAYGIDNDAWTETAINWNNSPTTSAAAITSVPVNNLKKYYELDVTPYVLSQIGGDKIASFLIKDAANKVKNLVFNSKENKANKPELVIESSTTAPQRSNALLFVENLDKFPSNDNFVFSKIQTPWGRTDVKNTNHDSVVVRIHNKGINPLIVTNLSISNTALFSFDKLKGVAYSPSALPLTIASGTSADLTIRFIAVNQATRVKVVHETLTITSNDDAAPSKVIYLNGLWQKLGEGSNEPYAQEMINTFGFKTSTGFGHTDPDKGDPLKVKGDQILSSNFLRADNTKPVYVIQMGAYHGCCVSSEKIMWYAKGSTTTNTIFTHIPKDGQRLLPRKSEPSSIATSTFTPSGAFGFKTGTKDYTDPALNPGGKIGLRVWKAKDENGNIIPNSFIISNDYLGTTATNYDYNDNMYFVRNIRPEVGTAYYSELSGTPSAIDFGERLTQSSTSLTLNLKSLGQVYSNGTQDPAITISSIQIVGDNSSEFSLGVLSGSTLTPQQTVTQTVLFKPTSQGLKIADLLVNYTNGYGQLRVPLYGIAKASGVTVKLNYRINSGGAAITANGKTWRKDTLAFDNLEPYKNALLTKISNSEDDAALLDEQSSNADKKPFRYEIPLTNGNYSIRLHFAELYWGAPGSGLTGGVGSRVMNVSVEGVMKLINFDVAKEVGTASEIVKNIPVTVSDGRLNINFSANVNRPMVCGIEVYSFSNGVQSLVQNDNIVLANDITKPAVYPNPAHGSLNIQFPSSYKGNFDLELIDPVGKAFKLNKTQINSGGSTKVDLTRLQLKPGVYIIKINSDKGKNDIQKIVIQ